jgi:hypothetical protein
MMQIIGLWRDTWWEWIGFYLLAVVFSSFIGLHFLLLLPLMVVPFFHFAFNRYDADGNTVV